MEMRKRRVMTGWLALLLVCAVALPAAAEVTFAVCADPRPGDHTAKDGSGWRACLHAIRQWQSSPPDEVQAPAFVVMVGDIDPVAQTQEGVRQVLGPTGVWYPVLGNHDLGEKDRAVMRDVIFPTLPGIVNRGPAGSEGLMYSFDRDDAHFIVLNQYYDGRKETGTPGNTTEATMAWLKADLARNTKPAVFVFGHEPAFPEHRHVGDSLDQFPTQRDAFWRLLGQYGVRAFFAGHTHYYSRTYRQGVWQIDAGQMRGVYAKGSNDGRSTVVLVRVGEPGVRYLVMQASGDEPLTFKRAVEWVDLRAEWPPAP